MKKLIFFFLLLATGLSVSAQSKGTAKLYGFSQSVSRGKAPEPDETTGLRTSTGAGRNYYLYATSVSQIYPSEIWVEGTRYGVHYRTLQKTPVVYKDETYVGAPTKVLVPKTTRRVVQLTLSKVSGTKNTGSRAQTLAKANEVVLVYKQGGKFRYATLSSLTDLESLAAQ